MLSYPRKLWRRFRDIFPLNGFHFDRPIVLLESDDWGRIGLRDREGLEQLRAAGLVLGERPYDFYTLETAEDLAALSRVLKKHHDSTGRHPCVGTNFVLFNLDTAKMASDGFSQIHLLPLAEGLPQGWSRPGLIEAYREGIADRLFYPALHGTTHFCRAAVERHFLGTCHRAALLHSLWQAGTPYIHWRMPWIGYEYWDPEKPEDERFLPAEAQRELIGHAVRAFAKLFSALPRSACAPGYRADDRTHHAWAQHGIRVAQSGPGGLVPPHFDRHGLLHVSRMVEFEPAVDATFSLGACLRRAEDCLKRGIPVIVSLHSINLHSTVQDFRSRTLQALDEFLAALEEKHPNILYIHDEDLYDLVARGEYKTAGGTVRVNVSKKNFTWRAVRDQRA
jgi:hypothetical protein